MPGTGALTDIEGVGVGDTPTETSARSRATEAVRNHDNECASCDTRKRKRCATGMILVRACWDAEAAIDEARKAGPSRKASQLALFPASKAR